MYKTAGFTEMTVTRFRSVGTNFDKCSELRTALIDIRTSNEFECLDGEIDIETGAVIAEFMRPITAVLGQLDQNEGHCAGSIFNAYTHLHAYAQDKEVNPNMSKIQQKLMTQLKQCLKQAIYEQLFRSYKGGSNERNRVPTRVTPADMAAIYLFPPSR